MRFVFGLITAATICALCACSGTGVSPGGPLAGYPRGAAASLESRHPATASGKIKHVVIIIQENRSFNNLFMGFPGATTQDYGYDSQGKRVKLKPVGLEATWDIDHSSSSFFAACNGTGSFPGTDCQMDGFDKERIDCIRPKVDKCPGAHAPYSYVPKGETKPYFTMGKQYVLADQMFASNFDGSSFISHQYIIAAQASSSVNWPIGEWGCDGGPGDTVAMVTQQRKVQGNQRACFDNTTLGDELDAAGISWGFYTSSLTGDGNFWSAYQAIKHIRYGNDWKNDVITPQTQFFDDLSNGKMRTVSWITPTCENSDHSGCGSNKGPSWVTSLVNAVGESQYWKSTVIFVFWDDYGGWYDPVAPQLVDYDGLGLRIPLLVISPYAKKGYVSHVPYEHGSMLRFIEDQWGLPRLSASDARANSLDPDCFDFSRKPRKFVPIQASLDKNYFMHEPIDHRMPDTQ